MLASDPPRDALRRLEGGQDVARLSRVHEPAKASATVRPVPGHTRHRSVERREAQAPTSLGLRIPGGGPRWARPWCAGRSLRKGLAKGASQAPMGSRKPLAPPGAPSPRFGGERKKGKGVPGARKNKEYGRRSLGYYAPRRRTVASRVKKRYRVSHSGTRLSASARAAASVPTWAWPLPSAVKASPVSSRTGKSGRSNS